MLLLSSMYPRSEKVSFSLASPSPSPVAHASALGVLQAYSTAVTVECQRWCAIMGMIRDSD